MLPRQISFKGRIEVTGVPRLAAKQISTLVSQIQVQRIRYACRKNTERMVIHISKDGT